MVVTCGYFTIALANFESSWREAMSLHRRNIAMERQAGSHDESFRRIPGGTNPYGSLVILATLPEEMLLGLCLLKAGRESPHWASARGLASGCDAADAANASVAPAAARSSPICSMGQLYRQMTRRDCVSLTSAHSRVAPRSTRTT